MNRGHHPCSVAAAPRKPFLPPNDHDSHLATLWHPLHYLPCPPVPSLHLSLSLSIRGSSGECGVLEASMALQWPQWATTGLQQCRPLFPSSLLLSLSLRQLSSVFQLVRQNHPGLSLVWLKMFQSTRFSPVPKILEWTKTYDFSIDYDQ